MFGGFAKSILKAEGVRPGESGVNNSNSNQEKKNMDWNECIFNYILNL